MRGGAPQGALEASSGLSVFESRLPLLPWGPEGKGVHISGSLPQEPVWRCGHVEVES